MSFLMFSFYFSSTLLAIIQKPVETRGCYKLAAGNAK